MTTTEAKQKAIREAYESLGMIWSEIVNLVNEGVLILPSPDYKQKLTGYESLIADKEKFSAFGEQGLKLMPSCLRGLYNNNGWITIESEKDLPPDGHYWTINTLGAMNASPRLTDETCNDTEFGYQLSPTTNP